MTHFEPAQVEWRKSTASDAQGDCVEVAFVGEVVLVRDTKNRSGATLSFTYREWDAFLTGVRNAEFETPG